MRRGLALAVAVAPLVLAALATTGLAPRPSVLDAGGVTALWDAEWTDAAGAVNVGVTGEGVIVYLGEGVNRHPDLEACIDSDHHVFASVDGQSPDTPAGEVQTGHGTGVAGVLCGDGTLSDRYGLGEPVRGVAPGMRLFAYNGVCIDGPCAQWFDHHDVQVFTHQQAALNNGSSVNPIDDAGARGAAPGQDILFVASVGNDGGDGSGSTTSDFLDADARILGVAAATSDGETVASYSSRGDRDDSSTWPDITAPACTYATRLHPRGVLGTGAPTLGLSPRSCPSVGPLEGLAYRALGYQMFSGTSAAAPFVSGVAATTFEVAPELTALEAKYLLTRTADPFLPAEDLDGDGEVSPEEFRQQHGYAAGYGLVNATAAVAAAHYLHLHPTATLDDAVECSTTGETIDGRLVLNPTDGC